MIKTAKSLALHEQAETPVARILTPLDMINTAVAQGAGIEVLEKLMALQERHEKNQARKAFDEAIAEAKAKIPVITKNRKVGYATKKEDSVDFDHEDLGQIAKTVDPILSEYGLSYRYRSSQDGHAIKVTCVVSHREGHSEETSLTAAPDTSGKKNSIQAIGSALTYLQRYTLKLALGLAAAKDDDGKAADTSATISEAQVDELIKLADELGANKAAFCQFYKIESFADIRANMFEKAKNALLAKKRRAAE